MPKIVIDISNEFYNHIMNDNVYFLEDGEVLYSIVQDGTVLPKGHGRLFDERDIVNGKYKVIGNRIYECEPALEADKENRT